MGDKSAQPHNARVVVETSAEQLQRHIPAWESLASNAMEPNPFYEHWMLVPALREIATEDVRVLFIYDTTATVLWGVFPIVWRQTWRMLPIPNFSFWKHKYCFLCTPLLRAGFADRALKAYLDWINLRSSPWAVVEFNHTSGDSPFSALLNAALMKRRRSRFHASTIARAMFRPSTSDECYLRSNVSNGRRKELRRQFNRLCEQGSVEFVELNRAEDLESWIRNFMEMEASGWKGRAGSAILNDAASHRFFTESMNEAFRQGRLMMLGLAVNGQQIALKCNILAGCAAFAYKIAYKEEFGRFSPGLQLELETIRRLHHQDTIQWMDSCAAPNHAMIDTLWGERRTIQTVSIPAPGCFGAPILSLVALRNRSGRVFGKLRRMVKHHARH